MQTRKCELKIQTQKCKYENSNWKYQTEQYKMTNVKKWKFEDEK